MTTYSAKKYDYAIVGQGIAGTLLAYYLLKSGKDVLIIDNHYIGSSSKIAAGIVNPITGKNFVKSWRIDDFLPFARRFYETISEEIEQNVFTMANVIRTLTSVGDENNWLLKSDDTAVSDYIIAKADISEFEGKVHPAFNYGELTKTFHVNMGLILDTFKSKWQEANRYYETNFEHSLLKIQPTCFKYGDYTFENIIFCEGHRAENNPFFPDIKMAPSKGEALLVKIPGANFRKMYKDKIFIVHQYDDIYWVGSGYEWNMENDLPTDKQYEILKDHLTRILTIPFNITEHKAAIRPTMFSRRPILVIHDTIHNMSLFNGLGTKGASIAPYAAYQFCNYLLFKDPKDLVLE